MKRRARRRVKGVLTVLLVIAAITLFAGGLRLLAMVHEALPRIARLLESLTEDNTPKKKRYTVKERLEQHGPSARRKLKARFDRAGVTYPPTRLVLVGLKHERRLHVYAEDAEGIRFITGYSILGASGAPGPKLREGDYQVPEGIYGVDFFNPNSSNHLSMRVTYPNRADRAQAKSEDRTGLGGEIYIHGKTTSAGCLAMGDRAIEEIWVMAVDTGKENIDLILSPMDLRNRRPLAAVRKQPDWVQRRYDTIRDALNTLPPARLQKRNKDASR